jgi:histidinol-phosphate/aromatic aminotransferase/cobyric acid decarboxylase-like protein
VSGGVYHGGESFSAIGTSFEDLNRTRDVVAADVLDAWFDPPPAVIDKVREHLPFLLRASPPIYADGLRCAIAANRRIPVECILTGAGSSDLIFRCLPRIVTPPVLILDPTYGEYEHVFGDAVQKFTLDEADGFRLDCDALMRAIQKGRPGAVILVNPNNPTGRYLPKRDLLRVVDSSGALFVVDEAYIDYIGSTESVECEVAARRNLVVIKSMSKVYALSGARVAYIAANAATIADLAPLIPPWAVSLPAQVAATEALNHSTYYEERYRETRLLRNECIRNACGLEVVDTELNFYLLKARSARTVYAALKRQNIFIREISDGLLRIAIRPRQQNEKILGAVHQIAQKSDI